MKLNQTQMDTLFNAFLKFGVKSMSMNEISKLVGVSKKTLYERISSKEDLIACVFNRKFEKDELLMGDYVEKAEDAIEEMYFFYEHLIDKVVTMITPTVNHDIRKYYCGFWNTLMVRRDKMVDRLIHQNLDRGKNEGLYHDDLDIDMIACLYRHVMTSIVDSNLGEKVSRAHLVKEFMKYHLRGICTQEGLKKLQKYDL